jgi:hypothetical protein
MVGIQASSGKSARKCHHTVDGPAKSESPVENGGKHPMISLGFQRVSTIFLVVQDFFQPPYDT